MERFVLIVTAVLSASTAQAASMNKCVDAGGHVTFTQQACAGGLPGESITVDRGGEGMSLGPVGSAVEPVQQQAEPSAGGGLKLTIVGGGPASQCGDASEQEIRTATVKNQVFPGMTADQAVKAWGLPNKINRSSRGTDQWVYYRGDVGAQYLYVSQEGCVTSWN